MNKRARGAYAKPPRRQRYSEEVLKGILLAIEPDSTVIDLGAGLGMYVSNLRKYGRWADGVDGIPGIEKCTDGLVKWCDLSDSMEQLSTKYLWALFLEVGEHVPAEFEFTVFDNVSNMASKGLIVSWGDIGQRGKDHINCHSPLYVAAQFGRRGWMVDEKTTNDLRRVLPEQRSHRNTIMVLKKI